MTKSTFLGAVRSSTILWGTQEESSPPVYHVISRQIPIWSVELTGTCEMILTPPGCSPGTPGKHWVGQTPTDVRAFVEAWVSRGEIPLLPCSKTKQMNFGHICKRNLPASSLSLRQHSLEKEEAGEPSHGIKGRGASECPASPAVWAAAKETHLSSITKSIKVELQGGKGGDLERCR